VPCEGSVEEEDRRDRSPGRVAPKKRKKKKTVGDLAKDIFGSHFGGL